MAWSKTGAWANQIEEVAANGGSDDAFPALGDAFPSLGDAASGKGNADGIPVAKGKKEKKKKAKPVAISLQEFAAQHQAGDELADLPTAPRKVDGEDNEAGIGGGFRGYGGDRRRGDDDRPPRRMEEVGPSRADESDDWGRDRKFVSDGGPSRGGGGFGGSFNDRQPRGEYVPSRADEADSWGRTSPLPPAAGGEQRGFGGSFNDRPRRQYDLGSNRADEADTWGRREPLPSTGRSTPDSADRWAGGDRADRAERWGSERPASREDVPPRERPRLVLKPRSVPVDEAPAPAPLREANGATPADSARPKGSSLFGAARPREEVLKAKGLPIDDDPEQQKTALAGVLESLQQQAEVDAEALVSVEVLGGKELPVGDAVAQVQRKIDALSVGGGSGGSAVERKEAAATMRAW